jgi:hypothetical protein
MARFKYFGMAVPTQNHILEEVKRLNVGSASSVNSKSSLYLISKIINIKLYRTVILPVILYQYKICSLTVREEHRLKVFENRVLRRIFGPERVEVGGG